MGKCQSKHAAANCKHSSVKADHVGINGVGGGDKPNPQLGHEMLPDDEDDAKKADKYLKQVEKRNHVSMRGISTSTKKKNDDGRSDNHHAHTTSEQQDAAAVLGVDGPIHTTSTSFSDSHYGGGLESSGGLRSRADMLRKAEEEAAILHNLSPGHTGIKSAMAMMNSTTSSSHFHHNHELGINNSNPSSILFSPSGGASVVSSSSATTSYSQSSRMTGSRSFASGSISTHAGTPLKPLQPPRFDTTPLKSTNSGGGKNDLAFNVVHGGNMLYNNSISLGIETISDDNHFPITQADGTIHNDDGEAMRIGRHPTSGKSNSSSETRSCLREHCEVNIAPHKPAAMTSTLWSFEGDNASNNLTTSEAQQQQQEVIVVAVGTDKGHLNVYWNAEEKEEDGTTPKNVLQLPTREGTIRCLHFFRHQNDSSNDEPPSCLYLAAGGDDCKVVIYQLLECSTFKGTFSQYKVVAELEREDRVCCVRFSPQTGKYLAVGGYDGMIAIARYNNNCHHRQHDNNHDSNNSNPNNENLFSDTNIPKFCVVAQVLRSGLILSLAWHHDETRLAVGGSDRMLSVLERRQDDGEGLATSIDNPTTGSTDLPEQEDWRVSVEIERDANILCLDWKCRHAADEQPSSIMEKEDDHDDNLSTSCASMLLPTTSGYGFLDIGLSDGSVTIMNMEHKTVLKKIMLQDFVNCSSNHDDSFLNKSVLRVNAIEWSPSSSSFGGRGESSYSSMLAIAGGNSSIIIMDATSTSFELVQTIALPSSSSSVKFLNWLCTTATPPSDFQLTNQRSSTATRTGSLFLIAGGDGSRITIHTSKRMGSGVDNDALPSQ